MSKQLVWAGIMLMTAVGCRQGGNPAVPLAPIAPMSGTHTRVPPPATGSYKAADGGYYQGQAAVSGGGAASIAADHTTTVPVPALADWSADGDAPTMLGATTPQVPATSLGPVRTAAVTPVDYVAVQESPATSSVTGRAGVAPVIPTSALQHADQADPGLRPRFRGMEVVDLTAGNALQPTEPPVLEAYSSRIATAESSPAPAPASAPVPASSPQPRADASRTRVASDDPAADPPSIVTDQLPWRRPQR